jgi:phospholipid/cholesterol/gamma-HCH transport system substrate-binding protein
MKRSVIETVLGSVVLLIAAVFLFYSYKTANVQSVSGYEIVADFAGIGGLSVGDDVQISGVKIGTILGVDLNPESYLARVRMSIDPSVKIPDDTAALISSESLLGGRYLLLEPGGSEEFLPEGGRVTYTQAPQNLEQLLGQFIFSMQGSDDKDEESGASASPISAHGSGPGSATGAQAPFARDF